MSVTIKDLAQMANTSTATVSRVLSNKPGVANEKRRNILALADKLGYRPNRIAQNLALRKSHVIGLIAASLNNTAYVDFFSRIQNSLEAQGYRVLIADSEREIEKEKHNIEVLLQQRVEGIIIFPVHDWDVGSDVDHFLKLKLQRFPFVIVGKIEGYDFDFVTSEETETASKLTQVLIKDGHKRIAFVGSDLKNRCVVERLAGVRAELKRHGLKLREEDVISDHLDWVVDFDRMLARKDRPTAAVFVNDVCALMASRRLSLLGWELPKDFSYVSFGNNLWVEYLTPTVTSTREKNDEISKVALEMLMERIENPTRPSAQQLISPEIVVRESTGGKTTEKRRTVNGRRSAI